MQYSIAETVEKFLEIYKKRLAFLRMIAYNVRVTSAGVMELVDVVDSKSTAGDSVPVRVRPPAPKHSNPNLLPIGETFGFVVYLS